MTPTFSGEVQFVAYADSSKGGPRITLRLAEREQLENFIGMEGKRFMVALVQVGDDEQPVPPTPSTYRKPPVSSNGPACTWLVMRCKEREFQQWLVKAGDFVNEPSEGLAINIVKEWCGVQSRKDIDGNSEAMERFESLIRKPYLSHTRQTA